MKCPWLKITETRTESGSHGYAVSTRKEKEEFAPCMENECPFYSPSYSSNGKNFPACCDRTRIFLINK